MMPQINPVEVLHMAFPDLPQPSLVALASLTDQQYFAPGALICREGAYEYSFYILAAGEVEFTKHFRADEERLLRTGKPPIYFGEMALLQNEARSANVRALSDVVVLEINQEAFREAVQTSPAMMLDIMQTLIERMRSNDATALEEMRKQKEEIEAAYEELRHQERLRTEFLTSLAHELRTPLTSANGFMQLIQAGAMTGPALSMGLQKVGGNLDRIVSLVNDLLFVQEQDLIEPTLRPVSVPALLQVVVDDASDDAQDHGCSMRLDAPAYLPTIQGDPDGLVRAFQKLLENAIKFSPEGGDITITAWARPGWVDIDFVDTGVGINRAFLPRVFERFEHIDRIGDYVFGGIGLGLPIAKHIIETHGGSITVESTEGQGSTFTVHLPLTGGRPQLVSLAETEPDFDEADTRPIALDPWVDASD